MTNNLSTHASQSFKNLNNQFLRIEIDLLHCLVIIWPSVSSEPDDPVSFDLLYLLSLASFEVYRNDKDSSTGRPKILGRLAQASNNLLFITTLLILHCYKQISFWTKLKYKMSTFVPLDGNEMYREKVHTRRTQWQILLFQRLSGAYVQKISLFNLVFLEILIFWRI